MGVFGLLGLGLGHFGAAVCFVWPAGSFGWPGCWGALPAGAHFFGEFLGPHFFYGHKNVGAPRQRFLFLLIPIESTERDFLFFGDFFVLLIAIESSEGI